jgi:hypothetical protein
MTGGMKSLQIKQAGKFSVLLMAIALPCLAIFQQAGAVPPDGGYPGGNTAEGQDALLGLTSGAFNTAVGFLSLRNNTVGQFNTAIGAGALQANAPSDSGANENTAIGAGALFSNAAGSFNTASGTLALFSNVWGNFNTAIGAGALQSNTTNDNTAIGEAALCSNTIGQLNTAVGESALQNNISGGANTAIGLAALASNTTGSGNTAVGFSAGTALLNGDNNTYIGVGVGVAFSESNTIRIGDTQGISACYIGGINGQPVSGTAVFVGSGGQLGTQPSSKRFKKDIQSMSKASEALYSLKPVTFRYKSKIDPAGRSQFGLVAEEVEKVNPDLVICDKEGKPYSVRYDQVNAMLLNEFLKEHRKVEQQRKDFEAAIARQQKQIEALTAAAKEQAAQIQKVSAQLEVSKSAAQTALNNQ